MKRFVLFLAVAAFAVSCKKNEDQGSGYGSMIILQSSEITVPCQAGSTDVQYKINNPVEGQTLSANSDTGWLYGVKVNDGSVTVSYAENRSFESRTANVVMKYDGAESRTLKVTQSGVEKSDLTITVTVDNIQNESADMHIRVSDQNETYIAMPVNFDKFNSIPEEERAEEFFKIASSGSTGIHGALRKGDVDENVFVTAGKEFVIVCFGCDGKYVTTDLFVSDTYMGK